MIYLIKYQKSKITTKSSNITSVINNKGETMKAISPIEFLKKLAAKSKITEKDAVELAANINKNVAKRFMEM